MLDDLLFEGEEGGRCSLVDLFEHGCWVGCEVTEVVVDVGEFATVVVSQLVGLLFLGAFDLFDALLDCFLPFRALLGFFLRLLLGLEGNADLGV